MSFIIHKKNFFEPTSSQVKVFIADLDINEQQLVVIR